jgi:tRNA (adenine37-N6)-methyltransferase
MSVVKLLAVSETGVVFESPDMIDGTPLLDIKPYIPECDAFPDEKTGWFPNKGYAAETLSDRRFADLG